MRVATARFTLLIGIVFATTSDSARKRIGPRDLSAAWSEYIQSANANMERRAAGTAVLVDRRSAWPPRGGPQGRGSGRTISKGEPGKDDARARFRLDRSRVLSEHHNPPHLQSTKRVRPSMTNSITPSCSMHRSCWMKPRTVRDFRSWSRIKLRLSTPSSKANTPPRRLAWMHAIATTLSTARESSRSKTMTARENTSCLRTKGFSGVSIRSSDMKSRMAASTPNSKASC